MLTAQIKFFPCVFFLNTTDVNVELNPEMKV